MVDVVVVRLNSSNLVYYLSPNCMEFAKNDSVVIDSENGIQLGTVVKANYKEKEDNLNLPLLNVIRKATEEEYNAVKDTLVDDNRIDDEYESPNPIYLWYDDGAMLYYSEVDVILTALSNS